MDPLDRGRLADMLRFAELAVSFAGNLRPAELHEDERTFFATCQDNPP
jgi:uncharacterized protein with HEPN domain